MFLPFGTRLTSPKDKSFRLGLAQANAGPCRPYDKDCTRPYPTYGALEFLSCDNSVLPICILVPDRFALWNLSGQARLLDYLGSLKQVFLDHLLTPAGRTTISKRDSSAMIDSICLTTARSVVPLPA
jgi:hypothetical protein